MSEKKPFPILGFVLMLIFLGWVCIRLFSTVVPTKNATVFFKDCELVKSIEKNDECFMKGDLSEDLTGKYYILKTSNKEITFHKDTVKYLEFSRD